MQLYYQDDHVTLYHADNRDVLASVDTSGVDLLLTDPPYGVGWDTDYAQRLRHSPTSRRRKSWPSLAGDDEPFNPEPWLGFRQVILWGANCYSLPLGRFLVWDKRFASGKTFFQSDAEVEWMKGGHGVRIYAQVWQGVTRSKKHPTERGPKGGTPSLHATQKPVALGVWCIQQARRVQMMFDPYAGSGSFLIAAKSLGIRAIGCEIEEMYCETAARRLERTAVETLD